MASTASPSAPGIANIVLLGILQILSWGGSFYLLGVLGTPIAADTGWAQPWVLGGTSIGLLVAAAVAPLCGRLIDRKGGRTVLANHGFFLAVGLFIAAMSPSLPVFLLAWVLIGIAMAAGLYDALFTALGASYGLSARPIIIGVTLISGFCTTIIWPILALMEHHLGWRWTCAIYGTVVLLTMYPLYGRTLSPSAPKPPREHAATSVTPKLAAPIYWSMTATFAIAAALMTCISTVLLTVLQERGHSLTSAIALSALIGPVQVLCRIADLLIKRQSPLFSALLSSGLTALGLLMFTFAPDLAVWALILYGTGNGMRAIVKSTLPLAVVKPSDYAILSGKMSRPTLIAQAVAPVASGYIVAHWGGEIMIDMMLALALLGLGLTAFLTRAITRSKHQSSPNDGPQVTL